jgi:ATP-dependent helicase HepA
LVSTEAGGEGRNFQFAHHIVNYDLPWNPMKIEQRIGRLDRIGQEHPVTIFNFHVEGTIEGRILDVLERRIRIFEEAVGGLDPILGEAEPNIRKALRLTSDERDRAMVRLGERLEHGVDEAREADQRMRDFILDYNSYNAEIARVAARVDAPIGQDEFELFLERLLRSAGTYLEAKLPSGERRVTFHAPFTTEHKEIFGPTSEVRRICMDPRLLMDSQFVEYFGFGHPIVDALVNRTLEERPDGSAAVRAVSREVLELPQSGWLCAYVLTIGGVRTHKALVPVFAGDDGSIDEHLGGELMRLSRQFRVEASDRQPDLSGLEPALLAAEVAVGRTRDRLLDEASAGAAKRAEIAEERTKAVFVQRRRAADDRIESCNATIARIESATHEVRRVLPIWEANLARATAEREQLERDLEEQIRDIRKRAAPSAEHSLLALARVVQAE